MKKNREYIDWEYRAYKRHKKPLRNRNRGTVAFALVVIAWAVLCIGLLAVTALSAEPTAQETAPTPAPANVEPVAAVAVNPELFARPTEPQEVPESHNREAMTFYPCPLDYETQVHIIRTCEDYDIDPTIVMGMIDRESDFDADNIGDGGESFGLMQVQLHHHEDRMDKLGVTDLLDPFQNITVGIDYLAELLDRYDGNMEKALISYNAGPSGAYKHFFSKGIYSNDYSREVLANSENLKESVEIGNL